VTPPALELRGIRKSFGSVQAVRGADFSLGPGEIHALLGENGAGKTTLMRIAAGLLSPDQGHMVVHGALFAPRHPPDARRAGIGMVHQHFTSVPAFSVQDNVALGAGWPIHPRELFARVQALNTDLGFSLDPRERAENLPVAALQRLEILKVLAGKATILILDEPTGSLAPAEADELLRLVRRLVERGASAILITHKLDEALRFADRVTVLRRGSVVLTDSIKGKTRNDLAEAMLGEPLSPARTVEKVAAGPVVVAAQGLVIPPMKGGPGIMTGTFQVSAGETVGIAAVEGNGERELLRAIAGLVSPTGGELIVQQPVSLVPEDRSTEGLIGDFSLTENLTLAWDRRAPWISRGMIDHTKADLETARLLQHYDVDAPSPAVRAGTLSGGNQQKLILARALELAPRVVVAENPGRGLDVRATMAAFERLRMAARQGAGVLIHSTDLHELFEWCDRIIVVAKGQVHVTPPGADREMIGRIMLGVGP
jgi:general nucleoside transport system ATP-binding protein